MSPKLEITASPSQEDLDFLGRSLASFNDADVGPSDKQALAVFHRDGDRIVAGLSGYTGWGWLYVQWLWVDEDWRGRGLAGRMLDAAEDEARRRGCHGALIDSFSPTGIRSYEKQGYRRFGQLSDFPKGRSRVFLQKPL